MPWYIALMRYVTSLALYGAKESSPRFVRVAEHRASCGHRIPNRNIQLISPDFNAGTIANAPTWLSPDTSHVVVVYRHGLIHIHIGGSDTGVRRVSSDGRPVPYQAASYLTYALAAPEMGPPEPKDAPYLGVRS